MNDWTAVKRLADWQRMKALFLDSVSDQTGIFVPIRNRVYDTVRPHSSLGYRPPAPVNWIAAA